MTVMPYQDLGQERPVEHLFQLTPEAHKLLMNRDLHSCLCSIRPPIRRVLHGKSYYVSGMEDEPEGRQPSHCR